MKAKTNYRRRYLDTVRELRKTRDRLERGRQVYTKLRTKYDVAVAKLADLSSGFYPSDMPEAWRYQDKLQASAARTMKQLAGMPQDVFP